MDATALFESNIALAGRCAARSVWRGTEEYDDVYADALLGLWDAARRWSEDGGASFSTFAWLRMNGAIADGRRERDHLSRSLRRQGGIAPPVSLDALMSEPDGLRLIDALPDPRDEIAEETRRISSWAEHIELAGWIRELPGDDRYVIERHLAGLRLIDIGAELGVTESRVCQIYGRAISRLRQLAGEVAVAS